MYLPTSVQISGDVGGWVSIGVQFQGGKSKETIRLYRPWELTEADTQPSSWVLPTRPDFIFYRHVRNELRYTRPLSL